jgi:hypothetical protein
MSREVAQTDISTAIQAAAAAWPGYTVAVDYENRDFIDFTAQVNPYLAVDIVYYDGQQMDLGAAPLVGIYGQIMLAVCVQTGRGTSDANKLMDYFTSALQLKNWSLVRTKVARPQRSVDRLGWHCLVTLVDFWYHEPA